MASDFASFRAEYPSRIGGQRWGDAERFYAARLKEGHSHDDIMAGLRRYVRFLKSKGQLGTEFVAQAATFLGRNKMFLEDWAVAKKPEVVVPSESELRALEQRRREIELMTEASANAKWAGVPGKQAGESVEGFYKRVQAAITEKVKERVK